MVSRGPPRQQVAGAEALANLKGGHIVAEFRQEGKPGPPVMRGHQEAAPGVATIPKPPQVPAVGAEVTKALQGAAAEVVAPVVGAGNAQAVAEALVQPPLSPLAKRMAFTRAHTHGAVVFAVHLWAAEYHASGLGMVDWFAGLDEARRDFAAAAVRAIMAAPAPPP